ncbi:MAG: 4Fe-4S dicluster domain-containing protein [Mycobacterium leprae]
MNLISLVDKLYGGDALLVEPALCLNPRQRASDCRACLDACPAAAIRLTDRMPEVDPLSCTGCARCEPACPTGVFRAKETVNLLPRLGEGAVAALSCMALPDGGATKVSCLAGLSTESIAAAATGRTLLLVMPDHCGECPVGGQAKLAALRASAEQQLAAFGLAGQVKLVCGIHAAEAEASKANQLDRRQFLRYARGGLMAAVMATMAAEKPPAALQDLPGLVPEGRRQFLTVARRQAGEWPERSERGSLSFATIELSEGCDGCEACTHSCPSGALELVRNGPADSLRFAPDRCMACGLCVAACPQRALSQREQFSPRAVLMGETTTLGTIPLVTCDRCGKLFHGVTGPCPDCGKVDWMTEAILSL